MTLPTTTRVFKILGWALLAFLIYSLVKKRFKTAYTKTKTAAQIYLPENHPAQRTQFKRSHFFRGTSRYGLRK